MGTSEILNILRSSGLTLSAEGESIRAAPKTALTDEMRALIRQHKADLLAELRRLNQSALFIFTPPIDADSDAEALAERIEIMVESGIPEVEAAQEAAWGADRERCWRSFIQHANVILSAPIASRELLLDEYQRSATETFGATTAGRMSATIRGWIELRPDERCH